MSEENLKREGKAKKRAGEILKKESGQGKKKEKGVCRGVIF